MRLLVDGLESWQVDEVACWCELESWYIGELLGFRELISQRVDVFCVLYKKGVFIMCWHHKDNKLRSTYRNIKSQDGFNIYVIVYVLYRHTKANKIKTGSKRQLAACSPLSWCRLTVGLWLLINDVAYFTSHKLWPALRLFKFAILTSFSLKWR